MQTEKFALYLVHLCRCVIENRTSDYAAEDIDFGAFLEFAHSHKLANLAYLALKNTKYAQLPEMRIFKDKYEQAILNDAAQQYYLDRIKQGFEENGIDYTVLKGLVIKNIYPSSDMRQGSDIDIYINPSATQRARDIMEGLGFECKTFGNRDATDNYQADKFSYVELHKLLVPPEYQWAQQCNKITDRLVHRSGHEYVMSDEDFYLFMICHIAKHIKWGGMGVRAVLDVWVYRREKELDFARLEELIKECGLSQFHKKLNELISYWFEGKAADEDTLAFSQYIAQSGWNGDKLQQQSAGVNKLAPKAKSNWRVRISWMRAVVFLKRRFMEEKYPVLKKHPHLLVLCWIHRGFDVIFNRRRMIGEVWKEYSDIDMDEMNRINEFRKNIGL